MADPDCPNFYAVRLSASNLDMDWAVEFDVPEPVVDEVAWNIMASTFPALSGGSLWYLTASGYPSGIVSGGSDFNQWALNLYLYSLDPESGDTQDQAEITFEVEPGVEGNGALFTVGEDFVASGGRVWWLDRPTDITRPYYSWTAEGEFAPHMASVRTAILS